jgi:hypothetical protein
MCSPASARRAGSSRIGGLSGRDTNIWRVYFRLVIVISYNLYAEAWCALRGIERRPLSGCLRRRRSEMLPVVAAHIRVHVKFSPAIRIRTFECCKTHAGKHKDQNEGCTGTIILTFVARVCIHMDGKAAGAVEALCAVRTGVSSSGVRLLVSSDRREVIVWTEVTLRGSVGSGTFVFRNCR